MLQKPFREWNIMITGVSGGIGGATAIRFAHLGGHLILNYRSSHERANEIARACIEQGAGATTYACDLRSANEVTKMYEKLEQIGRLPDVLINVAGISHVGLLTELDESDWDELFDSNVKSLYLLCKKFVPAMVRNQFGRIINVSSIWGESGASCEVAYSASKGAVNAFTKALAKELAPSGITVNAVAPGAVDTSMLHHLNTEDTEQLKQDIPAGRLAQPDEIASLIYFLALPESGYINGQIISPNGAWLT